MFGTIAAHLSYEPESRANTAREGSIAARATTAARAKPIAKNGPGTRRREKGEMGRAGGPAPGYCILLRSYFSARKNFNSHRFSPHQPSSATTHVKQIGTAKRHRLLEAKTKRFLPFVFPRDVTLTHLDAPWHSCRDFSEWISLMYSVPCLHATRVKGMLTFGFKKAVHLWGYIYCMRRLIRSRP